MIQIDRDMCTGCAACCNACPQQCMEMTADSEGFLFPAIDAAKCVDCGRCEMVCPLLHRPESAGPIAAFGGYCKDDSIRMHSSSGGLFPLFAEMCAAQGGVVYGAAFSEDCQRVAHIRASKPEELQKLYTSKYLQSHMSHVYACLKKDVEAGLPVIFSGTPCQIAGAKSYLGREYAHLLYIDIICHGVPSEKVWRAYTDMLIQRNAHTVDYANFRCKEHGWTPSLLLLSLGDRSVRETSDENLYYKAFLQDLCLRKSCYQCPFKAYESFSDITLADFWGVDHIAPALNDGKGTSLILINTPNGKAAFDAVKESLVYQEVNGKDCLSYNPSKYRSAALNPRRKQYLSQVCADNFESLTRSCTKPSLKNIVKKKLSSVKHKLMSSLRKTG